MGLWSIKRQPASLKKETRIHLSCLRISRFRGLRRTLSTVWSSLKGPVFDRLTDCKQFQTVRNPPKTTRNLKKKEESIRNPINELVKAHRAKVSKRSVSLSKQLALQPDLSPRSYLYWQRFTPQPNSTELRFILWSSSFWSVHQKRFNGSSHIHFDKAASIQPPTNSGVQSRKKSFGWLAIQSPYYSGNRVQQ